MGKKLRNIITEEIGEEIGGFMAFCQYSPFLAGRYIGFELVFLVCILYGLTHKKKLNWVDR